MPSLSLRQPHEQYPQKCHPEEILGALFPLCSVPYHAAFQLLGNIRKPNIFSGIIKTKKILLVWFLLCQITENKWNIAAWFFFFLYILQPSSSQNKALQEISDASRFSKLACCSVRAFLTRQIPHSVQHQGDQSGEVSHPRSGPSYKLVTTVCYLDKLTPCMAGVPSESHIFNNHPEWVLVLKNNHKALHFRQAEESQQKGW